MLASTHFGRSLCLGAVLFLAACEHAEGGVCQSDRDCEDGLMCDLSLDENRGVCRDPGDIDAGSDAGMQTDAQVPPLPPDGSTDAGTMEPPVDAGDAGAGPGSDAGDGGPADLDAGSDGDGG